MGGACFPGRGERPARRGQPWTSTLPVLVDLCDFGLPPDSDPARETTALVAANCRWEYDDLRVLRRRGRAVHQRPDASRSAPTSGPTSTGRSRRLLVRPARRRRLELRTERARRARRSTRRSTCSRGCWSTSARPAGPAPSSATARRRGEEYLLERSLFRRKSTGEVAVAAYLRVLVPAPLALRRAARARLLPPRPTPPTSAWPRRSSSSRSKQQADGSWLLEHTHPGAVHFALEDGDGRPSRWNTLRALRVLRWWDATSA